MTTSEATEYLPSIECCDVGEYYAWDAALGCVVAEGWLQAWRPCDGLTRRILTPSGTVERWRIDDLNWCKIRPATPPAAFRVDIDDDDKPLPLSPREARWVTLAIIGGCLFWGSIILWAFGR